MIHALADVQTQKIGSGTTIWQFAVVLEGATIGENCNINCHTFIENEVKIGNNVTIKSGVFVWDGTEIDDDAFIGPGVVFTNDLRPRSKKRVEFPKTKISKGVSLGANSTILAGVEIGKYAMTGIGSVVTKDLPAYALAYGNPAKIKGWVDEDGDKMVQREDGIWQAKNGQTFIENNNTIKKVI